MFHLRCSFFFLLLLLFSFKGTSLCLKNKNENVYLHDLAGVCTPLLWFLCCWTDLEKIDRNKTLSEILHNSYERSSI